MVMLMVIRWCRPQLGSECLVTGELRRSSIDNDSICFPASTEVSFSCCRAFEIQILSLGQEHPGLSTSTEKAAETAAPGMDRSTQVGKRGVKIHFRERNVNRPERVNIWKGESAISASRA